MTVVIQIGNTDNKLTQQEWSQFILEMREVIHQYLGTVHFFGGSATYEPWQNVCWVVEVNSLDAFCKEATVLRQKYKQDSVAVTVGNTEFI